MALVLNGSGTIQADDITLSGNANVTGTMTSTGNFTASSTVLMEGALTPNTGIYLGGTASANLLDDYEEGTWTPYWSTTGTSPTVTYTQQQGNYVKIGQFVFCEFSIQGSAYSGGSGNLRINGLPFTTAPSWAGTLVSGYNFGLNKSVAGYNESNSNYVNLTDLSTTNGADYIAYSAVSAPFHMIATITYRTTG